MIKKIVKDNVLELLTPENALPVIFDSPHSGTIYPDDFRYSCAFDELRKVEDAYVDDLFASAPDQGCILLHALFPRSYIDVNRARDDIDPMILDGSWPEEQLGSIAPTKRSDAGIGLIPRLIRSGQPIYDRDISAKEVMNRICTYYEPYHDTLNDTLKECYYNHGQYWHINCHSMPMSSAMPKRNLKLIGNTLKPSDIVLGDLDGTSCGHDFTLSLRNFWQKHGFRVTVNDPFKGVELISRYAQPTRRKNCIQIEINRSLYMNETTGEKNANYEVIKKICAEMIEFCAKYARRNATQIAAD